MARLKVNGVGTVTGLLCPITLANATTTTATWLTAPPNMPTVSSPTVLVLTVNPNTATEEIIHVTTHAEGTESATVVRAAEGPFAAKAHIAAPWVCGPTATDFPAPSAFYGPTPTGTAAVDTAAVQAVLNAAATAGATAYITQDGTFVYDAKIVPKGSVQWGGTTQIHKASTTFPTTTPLVETTPTTVLAFPSWDGNCHFTGNKRAKHCIVFAQFTKYLVRGKWTAGGAQQHTVVIGTGTTHGGWRNTDALNFTGSAYQAGYASLLVQSSDCQVRSAGGHGQETAIWNTGADNVFYDAHFSNGGILQGYRTTGSRARWENCVADSYAHVTHAAGGSSGSPTITDTKIAAIHQGIRVVTASGASTASDGFIPATSYVATVTAGTSFKLVNATGTAVNATGTVTKVLLVGTGFNLQGPAAQVKGGLSQSVSSTCTAGNDAFVIGPSIASTKPVVIGPHVIWGNNATKKFQNAFTGRLTRARRAGPIVMTQVTTETTPAATTTGSPTPTGSLFFNRAHAGREQIYVSQVNGEGSSQLTSGTSYHSWRPRLSPSGETVLFNRTPGSATPYDTDYATTSVWTMNPDGTSMTKILTAPGAGKTLTTPNWLPTGKLVYTETGKVKTCEPTGSGAATVTPATTSGWSDVCAAPDGSILVGQRTGKNLYSITRANSIAAALTSDATTTIGHFDPQFSPGGEWVYFCSRITKTQNGGLGSFKIERMRPDGTGRTTISPATFTGSTHPVFNNPHPSRDGWIYCGVWTTPTGWQVTRLRTDGTTTVPPRLTTANLDAGYPGFRNGAWPSSRSFRATARSGTVLFSNSSAEHVLAQLWVPGNTCRAADAFRLESYLRANTAASAPGTLTLRLRWGTTSLSGTVLCSLVLTLGTGKTKAGARIDGYVYVPAIGASGTAKLSGQLAAAGNAFTASGFTGATNVITGVETTTGNVLQLTAQFSVASASNILVTAYDTIVPVPREVMA